MSADSDPTGRIHAAEIAIGEGDTDVATRALVEALKESSADPDQLIDAAHELKSHGLKLREDGDSDD